MKLVKKFKFYAWIIISGIKKGIKKGQEVSKSIKKASKQQKRTWRIFSKKMLILTAYEITFVQLCVTFWKHLSQTTSFMSSKFIILIGQRYVQLTFNHKFYQKFNQSDSFYENALATYIGYCSRSSITLRAESPKTLLYESLLFELRVLRLCSASHWLFAFGTQCIIKYFSLWDNFPGIS